MPHRDPVPGGKPSGMFKFSLFGEQSRLQSRVLELERLNMEMFKENKKLEARIKELEADIEDWRYAEMERE